MSAGGNDNIKKETGKNIQSQNKMLKNIKRIKRKKKKKRKNTNAN